MILTLQSSLKFIQYEYNWIIINDNKECYHGSVLDLCYWNAKQVINIRLPWDLIKAPWKTAQLNLVSCLFIEMQSRANWKRSSSNLEYYIISSSLLSLNLKSLINLKPEEVKPMGILYLISYLLCFNCLLDWSFIIIHVLNLKITQHLCC